ncbi:MAG: hypothetical protein M3Q86_14260 [Verrucomicrobiota bacterium]|nr:hypothetical protein [Verrucomicrobiota bacterium]
MRDPRRWRNVSLGFVVSGALAVAAAFLLPGLADDSGVRTSLFIYGFSALLFGAITALLRHLDVRAMEALGRGEEIIARWRVEPEAWRGFVAAESARNGQAEFLPNELSTPAEAPPAGVEVIVGRAAVQVDESIHRLPRRGTPEITAAELQEGNPAVIELQLYYPAGGHGAAGVPHPSRRAALRFPIGGEAWKDAGTVVRHFRGDTPGKADFFHGKGDGSNPEDQSTCFHCGYATHRYLSHCPQCGRGLQSKRWSRRFGIGLILCGLILSALAGLVLLVIGPSLLGNGAGSMRFSGSATQARAVLAILGAVELLGLTALVYGIYQVATGRRSKWFIYFAVGLVVLIFVLGLLF